MTQSIEKQDLQVSQDITPYVQNYSIQYQLKHIILDYMFRNISFYGDKDKIRSLTKKDYEQISKATHTSITIVHSAVSTFLVNLIRMKRFFKIHSYNSQLKSPIRKLRVLLHKFHRIAPVFDYRRAKENARILNIKMNLRFFRPSIFTQLAIIIFITDVKDTHKTKPIIQTNLRIFSDCSAYAFHTARNKLGLSPQELRKN